MEKIVPKNAGEVCEALAMAANSKHKLDLRGSGSKKDIGSPVDADFVLDLNQLNGIVSYEPGELVLTALPATSLLEIEKVLSESHQYLPFEPPGAKDGATLGGILSSNYSGPRRISVGAARDHFLGLDAVSGRGEIFKSGGKVVKNVTGYDLPKLIAGSWGTLAAITEVTVKVLPAPEDSITLLIMGLNSIEACQVMSRAASTPYSTTGLAYLTPSAASRSKIHKVSSAGTSVTSIRLEGPTVSLNYEAIELRKIYHEKEIVEIQSSDSVNYWKEVGECSLLGNPEALWRLSVPPAYGAEVVEKIIESINIDFLMDWAGGRIWIGIYGSDVYAEEIRSACSARGGHALLMNASNNVFSQIPAFHPLPLELIELEKRIKNSFDPLGILNPGRKGFI